MREILNRHVPVPVRLAVDFCSVESKRIQPVTPIMLKSARYRTQDAEPEQSQQNNLNVIGINIKLFSWTFQEVYKL